jgi:hypothetical protein
MTVNLVIGGFQLNRSLFQQPASAATARVAGAHYSRAGHGGPEIKKLIAAPLPAAWDVSPKTPEEWKAQVNATARRRFDDRKHSQDWIKTGTSR